MPRRYVFILPLVALGCGTELRALDRAERAVTSNRHEVARHVLASLAEAVDGFAPADRARYTYLRGTIAYRADDWRDARHFLGLAVAIEALDPGSLEPRELETAKRALERMDRAVFRDGYAATTKAPKGFEPGDDAKTTPEAADDTETD